MAMPLTTVHCDERQARRKTVFEKVVNRNLLPFTVDYLNTRTITSTAQVPGVVYSFVYCYLTKLPFARSLCFIALYHVRHIC